MILYETEIVLIFKLFVVFGRLHLLIRSCIHSLSKHTRRSLGWGPSGEFNVAPAFYILWVGVKEVSFNE